MLCHLFPTSTLMNAEGDPVSKEVSDGRISRYCFIPWEKGERGNRKEENGGGFR